MTSIPFVSTTVKYDHAERNLILVLFSFAVSVIATRGFLKLTGYPQIASGDFHIAHVLWGGLLLLQFGLLMGVIRYQSQYLESTKLKVESWNVES